MIAARSLALRLHPPRPRNQEVLTLTRGACGHAPLEILRQNALDGDWPAARRNCRDLRLTNSTDPAVLQLVLAVMAADADGVGAAVAGIERSKVAAAVHGVRPPDGARR